MTDESTPTPQTVHIDMSWLKDALFAMPNPLDEKAIRAAAYQRAREQLLQLVAQSEGDYAQGLQAAADLLSSLEGTEP